MGKKKQFKGQSKLKGRDAATGINVRKERERIAHFEKVDPNSMGEYYHAKAAEPGALVIRPFELSAEDLAPTPITEFGEVKDHIVISVDPGTGNLGYVKLNDIKNVAMKPGTPEYERNTASRPITVTEANALEDSATKALGNAVGSKFGRARPTVNSGPVIPLPNADYDMDVLNPMPIRVPAIRGISAFLTPAEVESLHKGEFVASGDFTRGLELGKQDPFFFAVVGAPSGTIIANSKGSVLLPNVKIPLGSKFDYRL